MLNIQKKQKKKAKITMPDSFEELSARLEAVSTLTGNCCIWKVTENCLTDLRLHLSHARHVCPFCDAVKTVAQERCIQHDTGCIARELRVRPEPFLLRCHAGAAELLVPVREDGRVIGVVMYGPFRPEESAAGNYECAEEAFRKLPVWQPEFRNALATLVRVALHELIDLLYLRSPEILPCRIRDPRIVEALEYLRGHYMEPVRLRNVAKKVSLSESRFSHLFRLECGLDFSSCLLELRIRAARQLLAGTDLAVGEIAARCGFSNQNRFATIFRRRTGVTATEFRRNRPPLSA